MLFPYERDVRGAMHLIVATDMERRFPKAWTHLRKWEKELRARESKAFDDEEWYRFGRNQNIDKQDIPKVIVAQTVPERRVCADNEGISYLNNVRVNGILSAGGDQWFLLGVLNGSVVDSFFGTSESRNMAAARRSRSQMPPRRSTARSAPVRGVCRSDGRVGVISCAKLPTAFP
jgi:hypothetical protein